MSNESSYVLVQCSGCKAVPCAVPCGENAIAYFYGNIMVDTAKCAACGQRGEGIPRCIAACANGGEKTRLPELSPAQKRREAVACNEP